MGDRLVKAYGKTLKIDGFGSVSGFAFYTLMSTHTLTVGSTLVHSGPTSVDLYTEQLEQVSETVAISTCYREFDRIWNAGVGRPEP